MAEVDILMQEKQDDGSYNQLYPITKASNVNYTNSALSGVSNAQQGLDSIVNTLGDINLNNYFTKTQTLTSTTAALFGLGTDAVPDDVLALLSKAALYKTIAPTVEVGSLPVGATIYLNENGSPVPYIVVNQGIPQNSGLYDSSCDGTWVLRRDIYKNAVWDAGDSNVLPGADIFTTMASMLSLYDANVQSSIKTVKIPYCIGGGSATVKSGSNGLQCQIFPLCGYEVGWTTATNFNFPIDGAALSYFVGATAETRIANLSGSPSIWWLRSPQKQLSDSSWYVTIGGENSWNQTNISHGIRPAFVLPTNFEALVDPITGLYDVSDNLLLKLPGVQIATGSYVGTGKYGSDNPNSLTFEFEPQLVFITYEIPVEQLTGSPFAIFMKNSSRGAFFVELRSQGNVYGNVAGIASIWDKNTLNWYRNDGADNQLNTTNVVYYYIAIG